MADKDYWLNRHANNVYKKLDKFDRQLIKVYKQAYKSIESQLKDVWLDMLKDSEISASAIYKNQRLKMIMEQVDIQLRKLGVYTNENLQLSLLDTYKSTWLETDMQLGNVRGSFSLLQEQVAIQVVNASYRNAVYSDRVWSDLSKIRTQIEKTVVDTAITGQDVKKASRGLAERMGVGLSDAKRITITETGRVLNEACRSRAEEKGYKSYHILINDDACEECQRYKDRHFAITRSDILPIHPWDKCTMIIDIGYDGEIEY